MEKIDKVVSPLAGLGEGFTSPRLFNMPNLNSSPLAIKRDTESLTTVQMALLSVDAAPVPHLINFSDLSRDVKAKIKSENLIKKFKCRVCSKGFKEIKALYGHMRIHSKNGYNGFKRRSISKPKPKPKSRHVSYPSIYCHFPKPKPKPKATPVSCPSIYRPISTLTWSVTKKRCWKPVKSRYSREVVEAASILLDFPKSTGISHCQLETTSWTPLLQLADEACKPGFPSNQTQDMPPRKYKIVIRGPTEQSNGEMPEGGKSKAKERPHVCEICGWSYKTGQELGGHKSRHYKKKPHDQ